MLGMSIGWLLGLVSAVWVIYDVMKVNKKLSKNAKIVWIVCALLFSIITAIVYYLIEKHK